jgi:hypothetical protein
MVFPGESVIPEEDEVRLLKSGRIRVRLQGDREILLARPNFGQLRHLMERFDEINDEVFSENLDGKGRRVVRDGQSKFTPGGRWWSEVLLALGPADNPAVYDSDKTPSWAVQADTLFNRFFKHWTEVPLVSDVEEPEAPMAAVTTLPKATEPQLLRQVIPGSGGP